MDYFDSNGVTRAGWVGGIFGKVLRVKEKNVREKKGEREEERRELKRGKERKRRKEKRRNE